MPKSGLRLAPPFLVSLVLLTMLAGTFSTTPAYAVHLPTSIVTLELSPQTLVDPALALNSFFFINITIGDAVDVFTWQVTVIYDPAVLSIQAIILGSYWNQCIDNDFDGGCNAGLGDTLLYQFLSFPDNTVGRATAAFTFLTGLGQDPVPLTATAPTAMVRIRWQVKSNLAFSSIHLLTNNEDFTSGTGVADSRIRGVLYNTEDGFFSNIAGLSAPDARFTVTPSGPDVYPNATIATSVSFDGTPSLNPTSFSWDFGDGTPAGTGSTASHTYNPTNDPPTVSFTQDSSTVRKGVPINMTITASDTGPLVQRLITSTIVDWGDGTVEKFPGTLPAPGRTSHPYTRAGLFRVNVTVTDALPLRSVLTVNGSVVGSVSKASKVIVFLPGNSVSSVANYTITTDRPVVSFTEDKTTLLTGETVTLTITGVDPDGTIASTRIDWGDGTETFTGLMTTASHAYTSPGSFMVVVTLTDNDGATSSSSSTKTVRNRPPSASFTLTPATAQTGETISFTDSSMDPDGTIASWSWDFGDGATSTSPNPTHTYTRGGSFTITLTVTDNRGDTHTITRSITITAPPAPAIPLPIIAGAGIGVVAVVALLLWQFVLKKKPPPAALKTTK